MLVGLCLVIFWGTFFPLISEAVTGDEASVGPPWFNRLTTPLALVLVLLTGIGPVLAWRRVTSAGLRRVLVVPVALGRGVAGRAAGRVTDAADSPPVAGDVLPSWPSCSAVVAQEFWRGRRARGGR